jgi:hypothetical protein
VYSEFLGVIEGSELTRERDEGYLDRDTYLKLSSRSNSTFASQRDLVWRLFEVYLKRKRSLGHRDAADRTHNILKRWEASTLPRPKIDFLYVDEAQDNLLIDAFRKFSRVDLCRFSNSDWNLQFFAPSVGTRMVSSGQATLRKPLPTVARRFGSMISKPAYTVSR